MDYEEKLQKLKLSSLHREYKTLASPHGRVATVNGKEVLLFSSNSYLGLSVNASLLRRVMTTVKKFGCGSGGSRLATGNFTLHMELERLLASFKESGAALLFSCGYMANVGVISALCNDEASVIFSDALNHASIIDGCRLARAKTVIYAHNNCDDLLQKIRAVRPRTGLIVTDSVFSMDGDIAPLPDLVQISRKNGLPLMLDDAHATGVIGKTGRGSLEHFGLTFDDVDIVIGTLSKALASEGGFLCGGEALCDYVKNTARPFICSTALSPMAVAAAAWGLESIVRYPETVERLQKNMRYFAGKLASIGIRATGDTPIYPIVLGGEATVQKASKELFDMGLCIPGIRYPTVKRGEARLRVTITAAHTRDDMDCAVDGIQQICRHYAPHVLEEQ